MPGRVGRATAYRARRLAGVETETEQAEVGLRVRWRLTKPLPPPKPRPKPGDDLPDLEPIEDMLPYCWHPKKGKRGRDEGPYRDGY